MEGLGGGVDQIAVRSLGAGRDKGETGQHLPLRLYRLSVVFVFVLSLSYLGFPLFKQCFLTSESFRVEVFEVEVFEVEAF